MQPQLSSTVLRSLDTTLKTRVTKSHFPAALSNLSTWPSNALPTEMVVVVLAASASR